MTAFKTSFTRGFAGFAMIAALLAAPNVAEAKTKVGCTGASCRGRDPVAMGCDKGAKTLATRRDPYGYFRVDLRYSKVCNARWARATRLKNSGLTLFAQLGSGDVTYRDSDARAVWSLMWTGRIRACGGELGLGTVDMCTVAK